MSYSTFLILFHQSKTFNVCDLKILFLFNIAAEVILGMSVLHSGYFSHNKYFNKLEFPEKSENL